MKIVIAGSLRKVRIFATILFAFEYSLDNQTDMLLMHLKLFFVISMYGFIDNAVSKPSLPFCSLGVIWISFLCAIIPFWLSELNSGSPVFLTFCLISCNYFSFLSSPTTYTSQAVLFSTCIISYLIWFPPHSVFPATFNYLPLLHFNGFAFLMYTLNIDNIYLS